MFIYLFLHMYGLCLSVYDISFGLCLCMTSPVGWFLSVIKLYDYGFVFLQMRLKFIDLRAHQHESLCDLMGDGVGRKCKSA